MGNTIVCPLSAESRGDRDPSGHKQPPGEGRRPVGLGEGAAQSWGGVGQGEGGEGSRRLPNVLRRVLWAG